MPSAEYLRQQAATCVRLARSTFDLNTAEQLRYLAADLRAKADAMEQDDTLARIVSSRGPSRNGSAGQNGHE
jgi:hypothetical protein